MSNDWMIFPVRDLSGGVNLLSNDFVQGQDEVRLAVNFNLDRIGSLTKINGYSSYGERINDAVNTLGYGNFYFSGGQRQLVAVDFGSGPVSPSSSISPSSSESPSESASVSPSPTPSFSPSSSLSPSNSPSLSPSASNSPSNSPSLSPSASLSPSSSLSPSLSTSPSSSLSPSSSVSPSFSYGQAEIYVFNPGDNTWTPQYQNLTSGYKVEFCTFLDGVFVVNFADYTRYYNGTSWSNVTNVTNAPKAKYVINYGDNVYLAHLDISSTTHNSRVIASSLPDASYNVTWDTGATGPWFDVSPLDGDEITGLGKNFNRLLIFKEKGLWRYDGNSLYQFPGAPGTNNNRSIQNVLDWTIYFHTSGIYGLRENQVVLLSRAIKQIIEGVQSVNLDRICSYSDGDHYYLFLHDVINEEAGLDIKNCVVDLDVARMRWRVGSLAHTPRVFGTYRNERTEITYNDTNIEYDYANQAYDGYTSAKDFLYFGDQYGNFYQLDGSYDFAGQTINSYFETVNYYISGIHSRCELQALKIYTEKGRRCKFFYSIDDGPWKPIVRYEYRAGEIYYTFESGLVVNHIKLKCTDNSTGDRPAIKGFDFFYSRSYEI